MRFIVWFSFVAAAATYICGQLVDPDLWWHIAIGRWIVANRDLPVEDLWTMFGMHQPWRAYSWLVEVVLALVEGKYSLHGLLVLKLILAFLLAVSLAYTYGCIARDHLLGCLLGIYATLSCFNHFTLRPQALVWVYLAWLILVADRIDERGLSRARLLQLFILTALWANTHFSTALGIATVFCWIFKPDNWKPAIIAAGSCFLGSLFTPYLGGEWLTFFHTTSHPFLYTSILEFQPANILQYSTGFVLLELIILLYFYHLSPKTISATKLLICAIFIFAGLAIVKLLPFATITVSAVLALYLSKAQDQLGNLGQAFQHLSTLIKKIPREGLSFLLLAIFSVKIFQLWQAPLDTEYTPVAAVDFLLEKKLPHPLLNPFGSGGYLIYRQSDNRGNITEPVAIDGRTNLISEELWKDFSAAYDGKAGWQKFFEKVKPKTVLWRLESPLTQILLENQKWCMVFKSGSQKLGYVIFVEHDFWLEKAGQLKSENCKVLS